MIISVHYKHRFEKYLPDEVLSNIKSSLGITVTLGSNAAGPLTGVSHHFKSIGVCVPKSAILRGLCANGADEVCRQ